MRTRFMAWREIWRGTTASGREVAVQEGDHGDVRILATGMDGRPLEFEPEDGQSLFDALMTRGYFAAEEAATVESHVEDRS